MEREAMSEDIPMPWCDACRSHHSDRADCFKTHASRKLAKLWVLLDATMATIDNEILPLMAHLQVDDPELEQMAELFSKEINQHFKRFKLQAVPVKK